ncbi:MBL fold metallo-hydrolase [Pontibacillus salicampi]|uniref:MBL fold metallo-hydrolase n=1 Tax=Pontibacillus salicampi TaxID=1449801 RepID=A0ABV6LKR4_9BACI
MNIQLVRNATLLITYANKRILVDPFFAQKETMPAFPNTPHQHQANPIVDLPVSVEALVDADAVLVTHLHPDHFDEAAHNALPKQIPIYAQNEEDVIAIKEKGFGNVYSLEYITKISDIYVSITAGQHGHGEITKMTGTVSGFVFAHPQEPTLYVAGDTVWCEDVSHNIHTYHPDVVVVNAGAAQFLEGGPITMTKEDVGAVYQAAPNRSIVVTHMESLNHCLLSRDELKQYLSTHNMEDRTFVPDDGDVLPF